MRGYGQYCPIALAAEIFAERWTPIIIRNLHLGFEHQPRAGSERKAAPARSVPTLSFACGS
jgi:DNA-binding HxlR family transcriptional regulator